MDVAHGAKAILLARSTNFRKSIDALGCSRKASVFSISAQAQARGPSTRRNALGRAAVCLESI
jgi:hypothetical protein